MKFDVNLFKKVADIQLEDCGCGDSEAPEVPLFGDFTVDMWRRYFENANQAAYGTDLYVENLFTPENEYYLTYQIEQLVSSTGYTIDHAEAENLARSVVALGPTNIFVESAKGSHKQSAKTDVIRIMKNSGIDLTTEMMEKLANERRNFFESSLISADTLDQMAEALSDSLKGATVTFDSKNGAELNFKVVGNGKKISVSDLEKSLSKLEKIVGRSLSVNFSMGPTALFVVVS